MVAGDLVRLKTHSQYSVAIPVMVVSSVENSTVNCTWWNERDQKYQFEELNVATLEVVA